MKSLPDIKKELRDILPQGIDLTFQALKLYLPNGTDKYNDLILIESRYMETTRQLLQGVVSNEDAQIEFNKIRKDLLDFIESLQESHLQDAGAAGSSGKQDIYNGEVLYRIPRQMMMRQEVKCIVRLAFDRKILVEDLEQEEHDVMKDIRISDVMGVELVDPGNNAFEIRTLSDTVQFVEKDLYTEWIFYVKPILEGTFPLVLKISVIEIRNGVERKRNVVLEEKVEILSKTPTEAAASTKFERAGYMMQVAGGTSGDIPGDAKSVQPAPAPPPHAPVPGGGSVPAPQPQVVAPRPTGNIRKMASALAGLLVLIIASWAIWSSLNPPDLNPALVETKNKAEKDWEQTKKQNTKKAYEDFLKSNPDSELADAAKTSLDSIETAAWVAALDSNDPAAIKAYLDVYPTGRYAGDAWAALKAIPEDPSVKTDTPVIKQPAPVVPQETEQKTKKKQKTDNTRQKTPAKQEKNQHVSGTGTTTTDNTSPSTKPDEKDEASADPNVPVDKRLTSRKPVFPKCSNDNKEKEEQCTEDKIRKFVKDRLDYPDEAISRRIEGTVLVEFIVERDGSITDVHSLNDIGGSCAREAVRLVKELPKFKPGLGRTGTPVRVLYRLPIRFKLQ
jgi:TonB family protein